MSEGASEHGPEAAPALSADLRVWLKIGLLSFGGPAGQIALMQRMLVDELRWIAPERFLTGLDLCMLLPGPEAQQLATYVGWTRQGWRGGLAAGTLFVLPGALVLLVLAAIYSLWGAVPAIAALFAGVQCAVVAIVIEALLRLGRRALGSAGAYLLAGFAFVALALFQLPFPLVVLGAAMAGLLLRDRRSAASPAAPGGSAPVRTGAAWRPALIAALLWLAPLAALVALLGRDALLARIALRFSELAVLSFGGAYALLSALAQQVVTDGWLSAQQMADGLALAETTPGPLILVLEFVAFVAAHDAALGAGASAASALGAGALASAVGVWVLFLPSFLWIFLAAPYLDRVERWPALRRAVRGVTAAVVGVILHLSLWLALHVLFGRVALHEFGSLRLLLPDLESIRAGAALLTVLSLVLLVGLERKLGETLAVAAIGGLLFGLFGSGL
jgi:chromate transporter